MNGEKVRKTIIAFLYRGEERDGERHAEDIQNMLPMLREMPMARVPARLVTQLQVIASRERARHLARPTFSAALRYWWDHARLTIDNLMRPLALPAAGGFASAVVLFGMLVPTLVFQHQLHNDVPSGLYTQSQASIDNLAAFDYNHEEDFVVQLNIDERGSVVGYAFPYGAPNQKLCNDVANMILFTKFTPATEFGQPVPGKLLVSFRRFNIKG
jgi:hypothetical protein